MRKPSPISTSSPRLTMISLCRRRARGAHSRSAAALLLTTWTRAPPGIGTARRARRARLARVAPARRRRGRIRRRWSRPRRTSASTRRRTAARGRDWCARSTPVALRTGRSDEAVVGNGATASSTTVLGRDLPGPCPVLRRHDRAFDEVPSEVVHGLGQPWLGEQGIGARDVPRTRSRASPGQGRHGGGGRESNPPATGPPFNGFEDRAGHQAGNASLGHPCRSCQSRRAAHDERHDHYRLTQYAHGGGCACKIPPGELEDVVRGLRTSEPPRPRPVSCWSGSTTVTTPRPSGIGRHGAWSRPRTSSPRSSTTRTTGAASRRPTHCPTSTRWAARRGRGEPAGLAARRRCRSSWPPRCCAAALDVCGEAGCHLAGGHSVDDPEPKYGLAVTGIADPDRLLRNDAGAPACRCR